MVTSVPHDSSVKNYTDEQIQSVIVSRNYQNEIELDIVRNALEEVAKDLFPDEPTPSTSPVSSSDPAPSDPT